MQRKPKPVYIMATPDMMNDLAAAFETAHVPLPKQHISKRKKSMPMQSSDDVRLYRVNCEQFNVIREAFKHPTINKYMLEPYESYQAKKGPAHHIDLEQTCADMALCLVMEMVSATGESAGEAVFDGVAEVVEECTIL